MAKHARTITDEQANRLERNRELLLSVLSGCLDRKAPSIQTTPLTLVLERFLTDRVTGGVIGFEGSRGVEAMLHELGRIFGGGTLVRDGHVVGLDGAIAIDGQERLVPVRIGVGAGSQLISEVGPLASAPEAQAALEMLGRQLHLAGRAVGREIEAVAQGYEPTVHSPSDIVLVPVSHYALANAHLSRTGRYARDMMRCTASTTIRLAMEDEDAAIDTFRLGTALTPILAFLTDNTFRMRGSDPSETPRMARQLVWDHVDPTRCGVVPGTFGARFGFSAYERWVEQLQPISFESDDGVVFSCGTDTCSQLMCERDLSRSEAERLLGCALPSVRWTGQLELRAADSLGPHMAVAYLALVKGLLGAEGGRRALGELLGIGRIDETHVSDAFGELREFGWDARVYGRTIGQVANELATIARRNLDEREDRLALEGLTVLWEVRSVPRDLLLDAWRREHEPLSEASVAQLYGEGAIIPYDELDGEPPEGQTSVMTII